MLHETVQNKCYGRILYGTTFDYYDPEAILQRCVTVGYVTGNTLRHRTKPILSYGCFF